MVPEVGLEPTWALSPPDFESGAYTNFATPARISDIKTLGFPGQGTLPIPGTGRSPLTPN